MTKSAMNSIAEVVTMIVFIPFFVALDQAIFASLTLIVGLPFGILFAIVIVAIEIIGYLEFFGTILET